MKRIIWDDEEAALLVDTYRRIEAAPSQKNELLHQLSGNVAKTIAEMAEIYRSEPEKFENILHRIG